MNSGAPPEADVTGSERSPPSGEDASARTVQLEAVLDCIADGVLVCDREGRIVRSNPAADDMLKLPASERQAPVAERVPRNYEIFSEDGRKVGPEESIAFRAAVHGETVRGAIQQVRTRGQEPRWLMVSGIPLFVSGEHTGAVISMTDITERKKTEEELALVSRLYGVLSRVNEAIVRTHDEQTLYEAVCRIVAEDGAFPLVWVGILNGREVAPAAWWGRASAYLRTMKVEIDGELGSGPTGTCIREDRPIINDDFDANPATWPWREATLRHGLRASAALPLHCCGKPIGALTFYAAKRDAFSTEQVKLLEALCADISYAIDAIHQERLRSEAERALREREHALREADRRKDEFLGMLSHELRNPLAPIRNSVHILNHVAPASEEARRARNVVERQVHHLTRLVDDLLDVTRIARGKIELRRERVDLHDLVACTAEDFRVTTRHGGIAFRVELPDGKLWAGADPTRVTQVIGNLLHNAAKFTKRGDVIVLALRALEGEAEIEVRDSGAGIDSALLPDVFEPFVQGERTLARTDGGLGLGLALVKGITEMHGGTVRAESEGKGMGSRFFVRLPLDPASRDEQQPTRRAAGDGGRRRVLVVDDNRDAADSLAQIAEILGHTADVAYDGPTAIEKARSNPPSIVLCDIGLPGMSGYEVAQTLRREASAMHLVALTGYAQPDDVKRAVEAGFNRHIAKPCDPDEIARLLG